jgi:uncharacterized protein YutE (UPF0331/DUF86 family)
MEQNNYELEKLKDERDILFRLYNSLDHRLVVHTLDGTHRRHHEILYYVKAQFFDAKFELDRLRDKYPSIAD